MKRARGLDLAEAGGGRGDYNVGVRGFCASVSRPDFQARGMPPSSPVLAARWVRWSIVGAAAVVVLAVAWWLKGRGQLLPGLIVLGVGGAGVRWIAGRLKPAVAAPAEEPPMVSLVLLLREPRYLEARVLANVLEAAWGMTFSVSSGEEKTENSSGAAKQPWIVGDGPIFMVNTGTMMFVVHNHERCYFDRVDDVAERVPELRLRTIVTEHRAWLSVDGLSVTGEAETAAAYGKIARALAELANDTVLGLFQPASNRLTPWEPELEARLRSGERLEELFAVTQAPVVQVADDDPRMLAAVAEARRRWPEFVAAFKARQPGGNYAVKAPITREGNTEFIWLEVIGLEPDYVHGKLANDPVALGGLKLGDQVEVPVAELNDWTFLHDAGGEPVGLFTVKVLTETYAQQLAKARADG